MAQVFGTHRPSPLAYSQVSNLCLIFGTPSLRVTTRACDRERTQDPDGKRSAAGGQRVADVKAHVTEPVTGDPGPDSAVRDHARTLADVAGRTAPAWAAELGQAIPGKCWVTTDPFRESTVLLCEFSYGLLTGFSLSPGIARQRASRTLPV
ncbi:MAG: hypothetical protein ACRDOL_21200 [Streptosporangiaceae bacterium]